MESKSRRTKGEGTWKQLPDGRWQLQVSMGTRPDGTRIRQAFTGRTKAECRKLADAARAELARGNDTSRHGLTVDVAALRYIADLGSFTKQQPATRQWTERRIRGHLIGSALGAMRVKDVLPSDVRAHLAMLVATKGHSARTCELHRGDLRGIFSWCVSERIITQNVVREVTRAPEGAAPTKVRRTMTADQVAAFLRGCESDQQWGAYFAVQLLTGQRPGELDALTWADVDFDAGELHITKALKRGASQNVLGVGQTKNESTRVLAVGSDVLAWLKLQHERQTELRERTGDSWSETHGALVFTNTKGEPAISSNRRKRNFAGILSAAGLADGHWMPYELRHTFVSLMIDGGYSESEIADYLGHHDTRMVREVYRHRVQRVQRAGAGAITSMLERVA